mmetsp:Transcript_124268/g.362819  ORF Transcript_124268/g.362819 Transcript_124268/m.362819 type:complete len:204 (+) Transcript_124268:1734-2345(+)
MLVVLLFLVALNPKSVAGAREGRHLPVRVEDANCVVDDLLTNMLQVADARLMKRIDSRNVRVVVDEVSCEVITNGACQDVPSTLMQSVAFLRKGRNVDDGTINNEPLCTVVHPSAEFTIAHHWQAIDDILAVTILPSLPAAITEPQALALTTSKAALRGSQLALLADVALQLADAPVRRTLLQQLRALPLSPLQGLLHRHFSH